jgi:hypothetical protein
LFIFSLLGLFVILPPIEGNILGKEKYYLHFLVFCVIGGRFHVMKYNKKRFGVTRFCCYAFGKMHALF